jgi:hypothetical protein
MLQLETGLVSLLLLLLLLLYYFITHSVYTCTTYYTLLQTSKDKILPSFIPFLVVSISIVPHILHHSPMKACTL